MTESTTEKYRVGMIGIGRKGAQHGRAYRINPLAKIVAAADTDEANLEIFCRRFDVPGYADHKEMLAKENIDIAAPILPVRPNPQTVVDCAEAGVKAIMCEKPIAASLAEADRMVAACQVARDKVRRRRPEPQPSRLLAGQRDDRLPPDRRCQEHQLLRWGR